MSVMIKVSYETEEELTDIVRRLSPKVEKVKRMKQEGRYKKAFIVGRGAPRSRNEPRTKHNESDN